MKLVIVESPKKCQTISRYLGSDYKVMASEGHIRDLSTHGKGGLGIDIAKGFVPNWEVPLRKDKIVKTLQYEAKKADDVYLATDPDREGEAIAWHLAELLDLPIETTKRLQFHEITRPAILEAMKEPKTIDMNLVYAQETRRMQDRIIGFQVSSLLHRNIGVSSAGRVQSSTLSMIVDRQKSIDSFVPSEFWTIDAIIKIDGKEYKAALTKVDGKPFKCKSKEEADAILSRFPKTLSVSSLTVENKKVQSKPPFTTSTMQQEAYTKFRFSNSRTQSIAQKLYEGKIINGEHVGLITYMRTDSTRISPDFFNKHAVPFIKETYGEEYVGSLRQGKEGKMIQDAHEAIRPTGTHRTPDLVAKFVSPEEAKLYRLIYSRAMASLMAPKVIESTNVILSGNGLDFSLKGSRTLFKGFSAVYGEFEEEDSSSLPKICQGDCFEVLSPDAEQKFTKPDPLYNEASIVKAMEEKGIGRPSTYSSTIETLLKRKYVISDKGVLSPTEDGKKAVATLREYFPDIVSTDYTALMEKQLDGVENGSTTFLDAMNGFYIPFQENFTKAKSLMTKEAPKETGEKCPICGRPLVIKMSRKGKEFVGCSGFPKCDYIKKEDKEPDELTGENCPDCGKPLVYKKNKKGERFIGCTGFPSCHYTVNLDGKKKEKKEPITPDQYVKPCPDCKTGFLVVKKGKRNEFLGCTNFPKCRHVEQIGSEKKEK